MSQEQLNQAQVHNVAALAKLELNPAEEAMMTGQLGKIFDLVTTLESVDTEGVQPTYSPTEMTTALRADVAEAANQTEALLANAPEREGDLIKVPAILKGASAE